MCYIYYMLDIGTGRKRMKHTEPYGGYENHQTQERALWLDNDETMYQDAKEYIDSNRVIFKHRGVEFVDNFVEWLHDYDYQRICDTIKNGFDRHIIESQMRLVNYRQIAQPFLMNMLDSLHEEDLERCE